MYFKGVSERLGEGRGTGKSQLLPGGLEAVSSPSSRPTLGKPSKSGSPSCHHPVFPVLPPKPSDSRLHCLSLLSGGLGWDAMEGVVFKLAVVGK